MTKDQKQPEDENETIYLVLGVVFLGGCHRWWPIKAFYKKEDADRFVTSRPATDFQIVPMVME